ncbi:MAG TPA: murein biosynthesis integral membrane protein MurJ [Mycobacterium sp.]|nr:murein biosynthesis integral membrane protein MurJ [Mycobacterium sp.]
MALATLVSRITGFIRIVLLAAILGAALSSAFSVANQLPNLIAALVLEATFTAIFVPVLARAERDDPDRGAAFVRRLVTLATALLLVTTVLSVAAAPLLVQLMLGGDPQVNEPLTTAFAYLLVPQVIFYGLSSVFMAILNNRNIFSAPAWAPVVNNVVAIATLGVYLAVPGELSVDPVAMGNPKLLVLGVGTTLGVVAQTGVLLVAIHRQRVSLRPLWGIDARIKRFAAMAAAMVLYVLISQVGLVVTNQIASTAAASGPAIYNYSWLVLMLPFGIIGVTVLTVVMPRLSRNAAAADTPAVLADLSLATRLTMVTLIPAVALMTVGGPAIGSALFAYGNFGSVDAGYLGAAIALSAFTLIPYALVLLQLRVFYARQQPWTPILIIVVITAVKIVGSVLAPHLTNTPDLVAGYLGLANGAGFLAGAIVGYYLLRRTLRPAGGQLIDAEVARTVLVTVTAALLAGLVAHVLDRLLGLTVLTNHGGAGSLLRLLILTLVMAPVTAAVMLSARVPEARAALAAVRRRRRATASSQRSGPPGVPYAKHSNSLHSKPPRHPAGGRTLKGSEVTDRPSDRALSPPASPPAPAAEAESAPEQPGRPPADGFRPDISAQLPDGAAAQDRGPEPASVKPPASAPPDSTQLVPGASVAGGRYRLLVSHGGAPNLQFWQALDTALDRQVALTFVDPGRTVPDEQLREVLSRTLQLSRIDLPGIARVLDVVHTGAGGLVVSEWVRGGSLQEVANTAPAPLGAARAIRSLAAAAEAAHQAGVTLSVDHPSRVRVSIDGNVTLAFPATLPGASPVDDIRGIGAALYALLVNRWPLPESGAGGGLAPAERDSTGQPVSPDVVNRDIPFQIAAAATHSIQADGGIRSASTLLNLLQQATAVAERTDLLDPVIAAAPRRRESAPPDDAVRARRRRSVLIGVGVGGAIILVALAVLISLLNRIFGDVSGLDKAELGLNNPTTTSSTQAGSTGSAGTGSTVKPLRATVFSPGGGADTPQDAGLAIDGNPATFWPTDTYHDPMPFPNFKSGVGLMLQLPKPTVVGAVSINVASTGTRVELRSSPTPDPARLEDTTMLTQAKLLQPGSNRISVDTAEATSKAGSQATSNLLVWISTLGTTNGENRTEVFEITVQAAS